MIQRLLLGSLLFLLMAQTPAATLLAEYRLEDLQWTGTANEVRDSGPNGRHGSAIGTPLPQPAWLNPARAGKPGTCGYGQFPGPAGNGGALSLPVGASTAVGAQTTVSFWMYWDGTDSVMPIGWNRYDLWLRSGHFGFNTANSDIYGIASSGLANRWVHVVATFTNGNIALNRLYIDGAAQTLTQRLATPNAANLVVAPTLRAGGWQNSTDYRFSGALDDIQVFDGALSAAEVTTLLNATHACPARLMLDWRLDECALGQANGEVSDNSPFGNRGTPQGLANTDEGKICRGGRFNGLSPSRIRADTTFVDAIENDFTIAFWANPTASHQIDAQSASGADGTGGQRYALYPTQGTETWGAGHAGVGVSVGNNGVSVYEHAANYMPATLVWSGAVSGWTHIAVVYRAKQPHLYINGALVKDGLTSSYAHVRPGLRSAAVSYADNDGGVGGGYWGWYAGGLDEFRLYDGALDASQVAQIATVESRPCAACAVLAHYSMEDASWSGTAGEVHDGSGNNRHGRALGSPLPVLADATPALAGASGTCGYASFNGGALSLPVNASTAADAKTSVSFWMYWNGANSMMPIGWNRHDLWLIDGSFGFNTGNSDVWGIASSGLANHWVHVAAVFTNGSVIANKLWINAVLQPLTLRQSTPVLNEAKVSATLQVSGWQSNTSYRFRNFIDEVHVFDGEMTQSQVNAQFTARHACGGAMAPGSFNAFEPATPPGAIDGTIHTKIAGADFSLDIVALDAAKTGIATGFAGDVKIELLDASNNSAAPDANGCRASWTPLPGFVAPTLHFATSDGGRKTIALGEDEAWRNVRVRMTYPASGTVETVACATDNFAIRPASLDVTASHQDWQQAGTTEPLANSSFPGGAVHKAGQPFTLTATARNAKGAITTHYDGSPQAAIVQWRLPALGSCAHCLLDTGSFAGTGGSRVSSTASYNEVGVIDARLTDADFAGVDAGDGSTAAERTLASAATTVGRFVPDHFTLGAAAVTEGCSGFTYLEQPFASLAATVTAQNAAGATTQNYSSSGYPAALAIIQWQAENAGDGIDRSARLDIRPATSEWNLGSYQLSSADSRFLRATPDDPDGPFDSLQLGLRLIDPDGVALLDLDMDPTTPGVCGAGACTAKGVGAPLRLRFGRLHLIHAHGSELRALRMPIQAEFWNGAGFVLNPLDQCTPIGAPGFNPAPSSCTLLPSATGGGALLSAGQGALTLRSANARGCADVRLATPDWLLGRWDAIDQGGDHRLYDDPATARASFGLFRERLIYRREVTH